MFLLCLCGADMLEIGRQLQHPTIPTDALFGITGDAASAQSFGNLRYIIDDVSEQLLFCAMGAEWFSTAPYQMSDGTDLCPTFAPPPAPRLTFSRLRRPSLHLNSVRLLHVTGPSYSTSVALALLPPVIEGATFLQTSLPP